MTDELIPFGEALRIADIRPGTVRQWRKRVRDGDYRGDDATILRSEYFEPDGGKTDREGLLFLCIFGQLMLMGLTLRDASHCAFRYFGVGAEEVSPREPGEQFKTGWTILAVDRRSSGENFNTRIINVLPHGSLLDALFGQPALGQAPVVTALVVDISGIEARIDAALAGLVT